eukprot:105946_1
MDDEVIEVACIKAEEYNLDTKELIYHVKWKDYDTEDDTWEPPRNVQGEQAYDKFINDTQWKKGDSIIVLWENDNDKKKMKKKNPKQVLEIDGKKWLPATIQRVKTEHRLVKLKYFDPETNAEMVVEYAFGSTSIMKTPKISSNKSNTNNNDESETKSNVNINKTEVIMVDYQKNYEIKNI